MTFFESKAKDLTKRVICKLWNIKIVKLNKLNNILFKAAQNILKNVANIHRLNLMKHRRKNQCNTLNDKILIYFLPQVNNFFDNIQLLSINCKGMLSKDFIHRKKENFDLMIKIEK